MKLIASVSPNFSKKAPIAAMSNGYLCYAVNSTIFTYKNTKNFCFESSIDLKFSPNSLSILSNLYSRTLYIIAYDTQNIAIYDLLNRNLYSTEQKYSQIKTDPFSQNSFLSLSEFKYFSKNTRNFRGNNGKYIYYGSIVLYIIYIFWYRLSKGEKVKERGESVDEKIKNCFCIDCDNYVINK